MKKIGVVGIGNLLKGDDGIGPRLVQELEKRDHPSFIHFFDFGTGGLNLIHILKDLDKVLIIDAVNFDGDIGDYVFFGPDDVNSLRKMGGSHGSNLFQIINLSKKVDEAPEEILIMGINPGKIQMGDELSDELSENLEIYIDEIENKLEEFL